MLTPAARPGDLGVHLVRGGVAQRVHRLEHELALRGQPQAARAQLVGQRRPAGHRSGTSAGRCGDGCGAHGPMRMRRLGCPACPTNVWSLSSASGVVPADTPILRADDLGALRGDGIFETMHVRDGQAWLLDEHLDRMAALGRPAGLTPARPRPRWSSWSDRRCAAWPAGARGRCGWSAPAGRRTAAARSPSSPPSPPVPEPTAPGPPRRASPVVTASLGLAGRAAAGARPGCSAGPRPSRTR